MSADARLKSFIDRVLRLKEEQDTLVADIRDVYAEAKGEGYNKTAMGELVSYLRQIEKKGRAAVEERQSDFDLYLDTYERSPEQSSHAHTRARDEKPDEGNERLDDLGSVQDGLKMSTDGQPAEGLGNSDSRTPGEEAVGVTGGESAATHSEQALASSTALEAGPAPSPLRAGPATNLSKADRDRILRPSCQHPGTDHCGGSGTKLCHSCKVAAEQREVA